MNSRDYHAHISKVHRTPSILSDAPQYPNAHMAFNKKVYYEEEEEEEPYRHQHHHRHHTPDEREKVEVVEYERTTESDGYGNRSEVVYEEDVDVERDEYNPRRNKGGFGLAKWKTFRP